MPRSFPHLFFPSCESSETYSESDLMSVLSGTYSDLAGLLALYKFTSMAPHSSTRKESRIGSSKISTVGDLISVLRMYTLGDFRFAVSKFSTSLFDLKLMEKSRFIASMFSTLLDLKLMEKSPEELPLDVLLLTFATLEVPDLVRAGAVCSSWRAAYTSLCNSGSCKPQQTPCLLYTSESAGARAVCLYSLAEKKAYTLTLPDPPIHSRHIIGSSYGWIVTADERSELHIVNPITGDQIALPSVTAIEQVKPIFDDTGAVCSYEYSWYSGERIISDTPDVFDDLSELRDYLFYKAFLSSDPSTGDYFVALIHNPHGQLSFARAGDNKWTWLPTGDFYEDCLFSGQLLYACTKVGEIHQFDLGTPAVTHKIFLDRVKEIYDETIYIVQSSCGELLQIWRSDNTTPQGDEEGEYDSDFEPELDPESCVHITSMIKVHKVEPTSENLVGKSSLGANVLFLGHNQSLCLQAEEYPQLKANHVYFTDDMPYNTDFKNRRRDIGVFDLECNSSEKIVSPQLWSNWPAPVWLVPNPRRIVLSLCK